MGNSSVFSLEPTFTQGLVLGQVSILVLLAVVLKYLFLDSAAHPVESSSYHPQINPGSTFKQSQLQDNCDPEGASEESKESANWFNFLLLEVAKTYRSKLRDDLAGPDGDEVARRRVEEYANKMRPPGFVDHIKIHSVDLGVSAPRVLNARLQDSKRIDANTEINFDLVYTDTVSISLSTSYLFNYPMPSFARLPVSLTVSLAIFQSSITVTPPCPTSAAPVLTITIPSDFTLELKTISLLGSRAKLANVPKLHELIQHQVRRALAARGTWSIVLPGITTVVEAQKEAEKEISQNKGFA